ncbi:BrnT family toxin [Marinobacter zhanjiangensis]|uniref:Uncharacterized protein n=1 Tax=Marinobacter zhanjiangensis TaxID=578215 RepID=A0ABQ3B4T4_9GAMM|nr:BrnT family toxin [Marinobacter zhanjiangensis]GGY78329.1 hypothetical protein GCM10007071_27010 [Marinobacter zhanjiangensis]
MDDFEFDQAKSQANLNKHGIDFVVAQGLWKDPYLLETRERSEDESRFLLIGKIVKSTGRLSLLTGKAVFV